MKYRHRTTTLGHFLCVTTLLTSMSTIAATQYDAIDETQAIDLSNGAIGHLHGALSTNVARVVRASSENNDDLDVDIWAFPGSRIVRAVEVTSTFINGREFGDSNVKWVIDENKNNFPDDGELTFDIQDSFYPSYLNLRNGQNLLAVVEGSGENTYYHIDARGKSIAKRTVVASILNAEAIDSFDSGVSRQADFRARIEFEPSISDPFACDTTRCMSQKKVDNDNTPTFNLGASKLQSISTRKVPIVLSLTDIDPGNDDVADISPDAQSRSLALVYDGGNKKVFGPTGEILGSLGEVITVEGTDSGRRARISFRITTREPITARR